jgi:hypothetical protein
MEFIFLNRYLVIHQLWAYMRVDINRSHLLSTTSSYPLSTHADAVSKIYYLHLWIQIAILKYT